MKDKIIQNGKQLIINSSLIHMLRLMILFSALRLVFFVRNAEFFSISNWIGPDAGQVFLTGLRLDFIFTFYLTFTLFLIYLIVRHNLYRYLLTWFIVLLVLVVYTIDFLYFDFSKERLGTDLWVFLDFQNNINPIHYITSYWYAIPILLVFSATHSYKYVKVLPKEVTYRWIAQTFLVFFLLYPVARGGFRSRPLRSADASTLMNPEQVPLALNPALLVLESATNPMSLPPMSDELPLPLNTLEFKKDTSSDPPNIILIIAESFGKEYTALNHGYCDSYTPHLNALMDSSLVFHRFYANGLKSMDAVPAIFCGIPRLQDRAFIKLPVSLKPTESILHALGKLKYERSFFHAADPNTMGFKSFLSAHGLDHYYSIEDYPNGRNSVDYDGSWGIFDGPYLQWTRKKLESSTQPFFATIFTLSSHHPYAVPDSLRFSYPMGNLDIHKSIGYTDEAIHSFIDSCRNESWFNNTVFVIMADHSSENAMHAYRTHSGKYEIPLVIYAPKLIPPGTNHTTMTQVDFAPTLLELIGYEGFYETLGHSVLNNRDGIAVHFDNNVWHTTQGDWNLGMTKEGPRFLYHLVDDPNCLNNVLSKHQSLADSLYRRADAYTRQHVNFLR
ncbi:MAG: sulfatase-like hydrolase/transferase [Bacteroidetes bacterium]|nr:sulfatase-like hydrolase/transferase [Bacteroidota bacterium]